MENKATIIESLIENAELYATHQAELAELKTVRKVAGVASSIASGISSMIFVMFFMSILSIGLSLVIGEALGRLYYGFFIIAGFYLLLTILVIAFRKSWIQTPVSNLIIHRAFPNLHIQP